MVLHLSDFHLFIGRSLGGYPAISGNVHYYLAFSLSSIIIVSGKAWFNLSPVCIFWKKVWQNGRGKENLILSNWRCVLKYRIPFLILVWGLRNFGSKEQGPDIPRSLIPTNISFYKMRRVVMTPNIFLESAPQEQALCYRRWQVAQGLLSIFLSEQRWPLD